MSKVKEQLRLKMLGQLSDDKTDLDVDNAYSVVKDTSISFSVFCAENCFYEDGWWNRNWRDEAFTTEELFKIFENEVHII